MSRRKLRVLGTVERLEPRQLLASVGWGTNPVQALDVDGSSAVQPSDALRVINHLARETQGASQSSGYFDVNGDGLSSPLDALQIINQLNRAEPLLSARLVTDSGNGDAFLRDFITNDYQLQIGSVNGSGSPIEARFAHSVDAAFLDITELVEEDGYLSESEVDLIAGGAIEDGSYSLEVRQGESTIELAFTLDRVAPTVAIERFGETLPNGALPAILDFGDEIPLNAFDVNSYSVLREDGTSIPILDVDSDGALVAIQLDRRSIADGKYVIEFSDAISDIAGNLLPESSGGFEIGGTVSTMELESNNIPDWAVREFSLRAGRTPDSGSGGGSSQPELAPTRLIGDATSEAFVEFFKIILDGTTVPESNLLARRDDGRLLFRYDFENVLLTTVDQSFDVGDPFQGGLVEFVWTEFTFHRIIYDANGNDLGSIKYQYALEAGSE